MATDYKLIAETVISFDKDDKDNILNFNESINIKNNSNFNEQNNYEKNIKKNFASTISNKFIIKGIFLLT